MTGVRVEISDGVAIVTLDRPVWPSRPRSC